MPPKESIVHVAEIFDGKKKNLFLVKEEGGMRWYEEEQPTALFASTSVEALRTAAKHYAIKNFRMAHCGTKFTLPERDEHGAPATFEEMQKSLKSPNGVFMDDASGHVAIVREIPSRWLLT